MSKNKKYKLSDAEAISLGITPNIYGRYRLNQERLERYNNQGVKDACDNVGVDVKNVPYLWLKNKSESVKVNNPYYVPSEELSKQIDFTEVYKDIQPVVIEDRQMLGCTALFDRLVFTDVHVGLNPNDDGYTLYPGEWNEEILMQRLDEMVRWTILNQKSNTLLIHELGDFLDGYNGYTTRGGHKLSQNMTNQEMFDVGLKFKLTLLESLAPYFSKITMVNICNDNHSADFGYTVNSALKTCAEKLYHNVEIINQRKFIDHYITGNYCHVLTHGKDDKHMKFGFKPKIVPAQVMKIKEYIEEFRLYDYKCEFSIGDSHQLTQDHSSIKNCVYQTFGAFSPPSDWVKLNFSNSKSSFTHFNYLENQSIINHYFFK